VDGSRLRATGVVIVSMLAVGFSASAIVAYGIVWELGHRVLGTRITANSMSIAAVLALFAACDLLFPRVRLPMVRRQTPKRWMKRFSPKVTGLLWGLDTGSIVSTFRASGLSWASLILVLAGWGPLWMGVAYAASFCVPLWLLVFAHSAPNRDQRQKAGIRATTRRLTQLDSMRLMPKLMVMSPRVRRASGFVLATAAGAALVTAGGL
jgi:hypothetical protein